MIAGFVQLYWVRTPGRRPARIFGCLGRRELLLKNGGKTGYFGPNPGQITGFIEHLGIGPIYGLSVVL